MTPGTAAGCTPSWSAGPHTRASPMSPTSASALRAVTRAGQIKDADRHEKDDRRRVDDRRFYVLGWSNQAQDRRAAGGGDVGSRGASAS